MIELFVLEFEKGKEEGCKTGMEGGKVSNTSQSQSEMICWDRMLES